jgi:hypothetical protein
MKKLLLTIPLFVAFLAFAQDDTMDAESKKAYETILNKDWNGFDGKGSKTPKVSLIFEGEVDFPYYLNGKKTLKKKIEIYKYEPTVDITYLIPIEQLDFSSGAEIAYLSCSSDYRGQSSEYWENVKEFVKEKQKRCLSWYYKIQLQANDRQVVAIIGSTNWPDVLSKTVGSDRWDLITTFSLEDDLLFYSISSNLDLEEVSGDTHEEKIATKLKQIVDNKLRLSEDVEERLANEPEIQTPEKMMSAGEAYKKMLEEIKSGKYDGESVMETIIGEEPEDLKKAREEQRAREQKTKSILQN